MIRISKETVLRRRVFHRMIFFAVAGFIVFFVGAWLYLRYIGVTTGGQNPYSGPPYLMVCFSASWLGMVIGAGLGMFTGVFKKKGRVSTSVCR